MHELKGMCYVIARVFIVGEAYKMNLEREISLHFCSQCIIVIVIEDVPRMGF